MALERLTRIGSTGISTTASIVTHNINSTGIVTATEFYGGGSNLTGISGGGGGAVSIKDEGSALPTSATTLNFVGDNVTATGSGAEKTITVSGVSQALAIAYSIAL